MLDIKKIKNNPNFYINSFKKKKFNLEKEVFLVLEKYDEYLFLLQKEEELRSSLNKISKQISVNPNDDLKIEAKTISTNIANLSIETSNLNLEINKILFEFPNLAFENVIEGMSENDNKIIKEVNSNFIDKNKTLNHFEIFDLAPNFVLQKDAVKMSGSRHVMYKNKSALLIRAIEQLMLDQHIEAGFDLLETPVIVNEQTLINTGQLPKFSDDLFKLSNGQYLIPTSEVTLTNVVANQILDINKLPLKMTALTNCFRSEAGSAGKDTRGIIRLHQFRKVELVMIGKASEYKSDFETMVKQACLILDLLELPYRIVELCTGDMGFGSAITYDLEVWLPGQKTYREISSISCMSDFQSRRMKTRFVNENNEKELVYTYNGSALAIERTFVAIIENYYNKEDNSITIPKALKKYLNNKDKIYLNEK